MAEYNPSKIIKDGNTYNFRDTTKIPLAGSNEISGSLIPSTDGTVNLGGPSYQWNNAYIKSLTINGVACGDILTHNVSEFVDVSTAQTIAGQKIFTHSATGIGRDLYHFAQFSYGKNTPPANTSFQYIWFGGNTVSQGFTNGWTSGMIEQVVNTDGSVRGRWLVRRTDERFATVELSATANDTFAFKPINDNEMMLGLSWQAWKDCNTYAINGLNPGALSLWSGNYISLDTTEFDVTSTTIGTFASTVDGWATLIIGQKNKPFGIWLIGGTVRESFYSVKNNDDYFVFALIPVRANVNMTIYCTADDIDSTRNVRGLRVSPCQGNV